MYSKVIHFHIYTYIYILFQILFHYGRGEASQVLKNLPAMQETQIQSLGWEDPLEKDFYPRP